MQASLRYVIELAVWVLVPALVLAVPAWQRHGVAGLWALGCCALAAFVPGLVVVYLSPVARKRPAGDNGGPGQVRLGDGSTGEAVPDGRSSGLGIVRLLLTATALRIGLALAAGLVFLKAYAGFPPAEFLLVLSGFYFVGLVVETRYVLGTVHAASD